eukprot:scaffold6974_cov30-Prasinocladus_malaysianus.AAC.1
MDAAAAVPGRPGTGPAGDGLVVAQTLVAKSQVVHATLQIQIRHLRTASPSSQSTPQCVKSNNHFFQLLFD